MIEPIEMTAGAYLLTAFFIGVILLIPALFILILFNRRNQGDYVYAHNQQRYCANSEATFGGSNYSEDLSKYASIDEVYRDEDNLERITEKYLYTTEPMTVRENEYLFRQNLTTLMEKALYFENNPYPPSHNGETIESLKAHISEMCDAHKEKYGYVDWDINRMPERFDGTQDESGRGRKDYWYNGQDDYNEYNELTNRDYNYKS